MKHKTRTKFLSLALACVMTLAFATPLGGGGALAQTETEIVNLRTENTVTPLGIDIFNPRFSWQMSSNVIGQKQTAYQVDRKSVV